MRGERARSGMLRSRPDKRDESTSFPAKRNVSSHFRLHVPMSHVVPECRSSRSSMRLFHNGDRNACTSVFDESSLPLLSQELRVMVTNADDLGDL